MSAEPNWVERRAANEMALEKQAPELWRALVIAVEGAVASFKRHYAKGAEASFSSENGSFTVTVVRVSNLRSVSPSVRVTFDSDTPVIKARSINPDREHTITFEPADEGVRPMHQGKPVTVDGLSEFLLKDLIFPRGGSA
jgi:hypothetical protein